MAFKWEAIEGYGDSEVALYRLIGEMLQRKATLDDLERIRKFLIAMGPGPDSWRSLGEALHRTTSGSPAGYDIWAEWTEGLHNFDFDADRQGEAWAEFGEELSEASEFSDPHIEVVPRLRARAADELETDEDDDDPDTNVLEVQRSRPPTTGVLAASATQLLRMLPQGPYSVRIFGRQFDAVDEYAVLTLMKRGLFLGCHVRFGEGWIPAAEHPAFGSIVERLEEEALRILSSAHQPQGEVTNPR